MTKTFLMLGLATCLLAGAGCTTGEGERCNPQRYSDECAPGNSCMYPKNCAVAYCCPPLERVGPQTSGNCKECPPPDGGTTD